MAIDPSRLEAAAIFVPGPTGLADWLTIAPVIICLLAGAILVMARTRLALQAGLAIAALVALVAVDAALLVRVLAEGPQTMVMGRWLPPFGIAFTVDLAGAILNLTAAIVALASAVHALSDIDAGERRHGFFAFLMFMMAGVSGALTTGDIFNLYVWFEVMLISSFGLIILGGRRAQLDGAIKYGLLNLVATTLFLIATGYLYAVFGTLNMADLALKAKSAPGGAPMVTLAALFFIAFGMKAAAFPLNFWLPAAYHTPAITVSALFAGILTKVGIYALYRTLVVLFPGAAQTLADPIAVVAILTLLAGGFGALAHHDVRRLFGQLVIAGIGLMLAGLAIASDQALSAGLFYAVQSMIAMAGLYMLAGIAGRMTGSHSILRMAGLWRRSPVLSALAVLMLLAVSGLPPLSGFWPKIMMLGEALKAGRPLLAGAILLSGLLVTIAMARIILFAFWRDRQEDPVQGAGDGLAPEAATIAGSAASSPAILALPRLPTATLGALVILLLAIGLHPDPLVSLTLSAARGLADPAAYLNSVFPPALSEGLPEVLP